MPSARLKKIGAQPTGRLEKLISPPNRSPDEGLPYWREKAFNTVLLTAIFFGVPAVVSGIGYDIRKGLWGLAAVAISLYLFVIALFVCKRFPYALRAGCGVSIFYVIALMGLYKLGLFSSALIWLFVFPLAACLFLGFWPLVLALALCGLTFLGYDALLVSGAVAVALPPDGNSLHRVLMIEGDFIFLALVVNVVIAYLTNRFRMSLASEQTTREALESEIEKRKQLAAALRESEQKYRTYFESVSDVIYTLDTDLRVTGVSPSALKLADYTEAEVMGKPFHELNVLDPAYLEQALEDCATVLDGGQAASVYEFIMKDGRRRFGQVHGAPLRRDGEIVGIITVGRDITELKAAWDALEQSEARFRETVELLPSVVLEMDLDFRITYTNNRGLDLFGLDQADFDRGINAMAYVHPDDREQIRKAFDKLRATGRIDPAVIRALAGGEAEVTAVVNSAPIYQGEQVTGVRTCLTDITAQRKMEEELFNARQLESLATLAGGIAHDYNNLLAVILGNLSLAQTEAGTSETVGQWLAEAETASLRAKELTARLLTFTPSGAPSPEACEIQSLLTDVVASTLPSDQPIDCTLSSPPDLWPAYIDPEQCRSLFSSVLSNAAEAVAGDGEIRIAAENVNIDSPAEPQLAAGKYLKVAITDNGGGIHPDILIKIFDPYFSTKERGAQKGMGLGLTVAQSIANRHGGRIIVESEPANGTTAMIYLPAFEEEKTEAVETTPAPPASLPAQKRKPRVLVMDDESMIRELLHNLLDRLGYEAESTVEGKEAVNCYREADEKGVPFDLVLLDLTNKIGMDGATAMRQILDINPGAVGIVASGYAHDPILGKPREYGFSGAIGKPYSLHDLKRLLADVLGSKI